MNSNQQLVISNQEEVPSDNANKAQIANPASEFCVSNGGKSEIRTNADGSQAGYCVLSGGGECEEWAYMRGECKNSHR